MNNNVNHIFQLISQHVNVIEKSTILSYFQGHEAIIIGGITYIGSLMLLNNLEKIMNEKDASTISSITNPTFSVNQVNQQFITPVTSDRRLPDIEELKIKPFYVGSRLNVKQFITLQKFEEIDGIQKKSKEWSALYKEDIYIYKKLEQM